MGVFRASESMTKGSNRQNIKNIELWPEFTGSYENKKCNLWFIKRVYENKCRLRVLEWFDN